MSKSILEVNNVSMRFVLSKEKITSLKDYVLKSLKRQIKYKEFYAVKNVSFSVNKGDRVGVLGLNGAGKSTLLKIIAGVYKPTEGTVVKRGKIIPLLELGAGFEKQYTGKENIYLYGSFLGYSKEFINEKYDEIVAFSELGDFIDRPVKSYSSGMYSKLAFSITAILETDIMLIDEVLSVGDAKFKKKSYAKMKELISNDDRTVLIVSHSSDTIRNLCDNVLWIHDGEMKMYGTTEEVLPQYDEFMK